ncbi:MAG: hypothetical protein HFG51_07050 [Lachnospiraceae bacterium]|nr:hypothetical protein [Lachnospiraceae bacterium]
MKKFLKQLALYTILLSILVFSINRWYLFMDKSDDNWTNKFMSVPENIQICNLGSSHGLYSFNYEDLENDFTCFNFALASQSLSYDLRILQQYQNHLAEGCIVFIPVSYFSFFGIDETEEAEFLSKNKQYYDFLPPGKIKAYDLSTHIFERFLPALTAYETLPAVLFGGRTSSNDEIWSRSAQTIDIPSDAAQAYARHLVNEKLDGEGKRIHNKEEIHALYQIIALCQEIGAVPILVTTPYLREYLDEVNTNVPDFAEDFYGIIDQVTAETKTPYCNEASSPDFIDRKDLFMNADHLNKEGARLFTQKIVFNVSAD